MEIGCADSIILKKLNKDINYDGFDVVDDFMKNQKKYFKIKIIILKIKVFMKLILINMIKKNYNFVNRCISS